MRVTRQMYGPYARQVIGGRLKFWFALITDRGEVRRYEVLFAKGGLRGIARYRPFSEGPSPRGGSHFTAYRVPDNITDHPSAPHKKGALIKETARLLLTGDDLADVIRICLTGELPSRFKEERDGLQQRPADDPG